MCGGLSQTFALTNYFLSRTVKTTVLEIVMNTVPLDLQIREIAKSTLVRFTKKIIVIVSFIITN